MIDARILVFSTLALAAGTSAVVGLNRPVRAAPEGAGDRAWALLAEADELCRSKRGRFVSESRSSNSSSTALELPLAGLEGRAATARRAIAGEALEIARELAERSPKARFSASILRTESRLRRSCATGGTSSDSAGGPRRSLDGSGSSDRTVLLAPFLARLNEAASRELERTVEAAEMAELAAMTEAGVVGPSDTSPSPNAEEPVTGSAAESVPTQNLADLPARKVIPEPSEIRIGSASAGYRERVRRWAPVFEREASALRVSRSELQLEIDRRSMAEARGACRRFAVALARVDTELVESAPSRGLSLRIRRMVDRYWRGVAQCAAGRPAAAFAYLSEGDREWATIAQVASRMFRPRPMLPLRAPGPVDAPPHASE